MSTVQTSEAAVGSTIVDGIAYVGDSRGRLIIVDASVPENASVIGGVDATDSAYGAVAAGDLILVYGQGGIALVEKQCTGVSAVSEKLPIGSRLSRTFPNPFNPRTMIQLSVPRQDAVSLQVFDLSGRLIRTLVDSETKPAGTYDIPWDGRDAGGRSVSAGSYLYKAKVGSVVESGRMTLLK